MPVESATYISQLNPSYPTGAETKAEGDNQIRMFKGAVQNSFPNVSGAVTVTHAELNSVTSRALRAGDTYSGTHAFSGATAVTVPTVTGSDNSTNAASTAFVQTAIAAVNSQTALTTVESTGTSVTASAGQHVVCTNAAAVTVTLPATPTLGQRVKVTFTNNLYTNLVSPNGGRIFGDTANQTVNAWRASVEFVYSGNASIGWTY